MLSLCGSFISFVRVADTVYDVMIAREALQLGNGYF